MPFVFECPNCQRKIRTVEQYGGRNRKCPGCKLLISIPHTEGEPSRIMEEPIVEQPEELPLEDPVIFEPLDPPAGPPPVGVVVTPPAAIQPQRKQPKVESEETAGFGDYLKFRRLSSPAMVQFLFWSGVACIVSTMLGTSIWAFQIAFSGSGGMATLLFTVSIVGGVLSLFWLRMHCEALIMLGRVYRQHYPQDADAEHR